MDSWTVEVKPEVEDWLRGLAPEAFEQAGRPITLLEANGVALGFPHTSQLSGKLRELRVNVAGRRTRITYYMAARGYIVLLTVFAKTQRQERAEIARAERAMTTCETEHAHGDVEEGG